MVSVGVWTYLLISVFYLVNAVDNGRFYANAASAVHHGGEKSSQARRKSTP